MLGGPAGSGQPHPFSSSSPRHCPPPSADPMLWTDRVSPNSDVEVLIPSVMALGGGVFGRWLGIDEALRVGPCDGISALMRRGRDTGASPLCPGGCREKTAIYKPEGGLSQRTESAGFKSWKHEKGRSEDTHLSGCITIRQW